MKRMAGFFALMAGVIFAACFQSPYVNGWYRCDDDSGCTVGWVCDDGVCCNPNGTPACPTRVPPSGVCAGGVGPKLFHTDLDHDGFGGQTTTQPFCAAPVLSAWVENGGDCLDTPNLGESSHPDAGEQCDGLDNDCDGLVDEGFDGGLFFADSDNDTYGDPSTARTYCVPPVSGWVAAGNDCDPDVSTIHPNAVEDCNGKDDDCDGFVDNNVAGLSGSCMVPGAVGICAAGAQACSGGAIVCTALQNPKADEVCNGLDDTCNGVVDERPGCGGALDLFDSSGQSVSAKRIDFPALQGGGGFSGCPSGATGSPYSVLGNAWTGSGSNSHVLRAQKQAGSWDLTKAGTKLHVKFQVSVNNPGTPVWAAHGQPVLYLCDANGGYNRYVRTTAQALDNAITWEVTLPLGSPADAGYTQGGATLDATQATAVELLIQPQPATSGSPTFTLSAFELGFQ